MDANFTLFCEELSIIFASHSGDRIYFQLIGIVDILLAFLGMSFNLLAFGTLWRMKNYEPSTRFVLLNLTGSDVGMSFCLFNYAIALFLAAQGEFNCVFLIVNTSLQNTLFGHSSLSLNLAVVERYFKVFYPFLFRRMVSERRLLWIFITSWIFITVYFFISLFTHQPKLMSAFVAGFFFFCSVLLVFLVYLRLLLSALKKRRKVVSVDNSGSTTMPRQKSKKLSLVMTIVITSIACRIPLPVYMIAYHLDSKWSGIYFHILWTLFMCNSVFNPICYCFFDIVIRQGMQRRLENLWCRQAHSI